MCIYMILIIYVDTDITYFTIYISESVWALLARYVYTY